jgi:hypothetical protein
MQGAEIDLRRERAAQNQSLFREVNERIEDLAAPSSFTSFICECENETCDEVCPLTLEEYERIRAKPNRFFVLPGHNVPEVEQVVEQSDRYVVVAKLGAGRPIAEHLNPRTRRAGGTRT